MRLFLLECPLLTVHSCPGGSGVCNYPGNKTWKECTCLSSVSPFLCLSLSPSLGWQEGHASSLRIMWQCASFLVYAQSFDSVCETFVSSSVIYTALPYPSKKQQMWIQCIFSGLTSNTSLPLVTKMEVCVCNEMIRFAFSPWIIENLFFFFFLEKISWNSLWFLACV